MKTVEKLIKAREELLVLESERKRMDFSGNFIFSLSMISAVGCVAYPSALSISLFFLIHLFLAWFMGDRFNLSNKLWEKRDEVDDLERRVEFYKKIGKQD